MEPNRKVSAVIFDMDGTIIDSEPIFKFVAKKSALELGYCLNDDLYSSWVGLPRESLEAAILKSLGKSFPMLKFKQIFAENWIIYTEKNGINPKNGMSELLRYLSEEGIAIAVATSTPTPQAIRSLEIANLKSFFDKIVGGEQVVSGKPAPDIFLKAASALEVSPSRCLALEDSAIGIKSAAAAGMLTILVPDTVFPTRETIMLADYVLPSSKVASDFVRAIFK